jgi:hypothetical protein
MCKRKASRASAPAPPGSDPRENCLAGEAICESGGGRRQYSNLTVLLENQCNEPFSRYLDAEPAMGKRHERRAYRSMPCFFEIRASNIPNAGLGVFTRIPLNATIIFGPYEVTTPFPLDRDWRSSLPRLPLLDPHFRERKTALRQL